MGKYRKAYTLYKRKLTGKRKDKGDTVVWYYQAYDSQGRRIPGQSTGKTTKGEAEQYCDELLRQGKLIPSKPPVAESEPRTPTLREWGESESWWQWNKCRYLRAQLAGSDEDKPAVSRRYADDALRDLKTYILPAHGQKRLDEITPRDCERLLFDWQEKGLSKKSINNKSSIERIMLGEAERLGLIERNPWDRVKGFKPSRHAKGILTPNEARKLLNPDTVETVWKGNQVYYSASLLAAVTGMRLGEVLALKGTDLFPDHVHVAGSWRGAKYGMGKTKTKRVDDIPIPRFVYDTIDAWRTWEGFVFSFKAGAWPVSGNRTLDALYRALDEIGIESEERERRNIKFHSWRAFANTFMRARGISGEKVRQLIRHDSEEMTERYSVFRVEDFKDVAEAQEALVAGIRAPSETVAVAKEGRR
jgi:integrase